MSNNFVINPYLSTLNYSNHFPFLSHLKDIRSSSFLGNEYHQSSCVFVGDAGCSPQQGTNISSSPKSASLILYYPIPVPYSPIRSSKNLAIFYSKLLGPEGGIEPDLNGFSDSTIVIAPQVPFDPDSFRLYVAVNLRFFDANFYFGCSCKARLLAYRALHKTNNLAYNPPAIKVRLNTCLSALDWPTASTRAIPWKGGIPMRKYELVCVIQPDLDEAALNGVLDRVKGWITESGGSVDKVDVWGKRRLAYEIRKQREGNYVLIDLSIPPTATSALEQNLRYTETLMRHLLTSVE